MLMLYIKYMSRSEASNIDKTIVANIIDVLTDRNSIKNKRITSGQTSYFHHHEESDKTVTACPEKTYEKVNLYVTKQLPQKSSVRKGVLIN